MNLKFTAQIVVVSGPDAVRFKGFICLFKISAQTFMDAAQQAQAKAEELNGKVAKLEQNE